MLRCVEVNGLSLKFSDDWTFMKDPEICLEAVTQNGEALLVVNNTLHIEKEIVLPAVTT